MAHENAIGKTQINGAEMGSPISISLNSQLDAIIRLEETVSAILSRTESVTLMAPKSETKPCAYPVANCQLQERLMESTRRIDLCSELLRDRLEYIQL